MASIGEFKRAFQKKIVSRDLHIKAWSGATRRSPNLLEINTKPIPTVLYVKISNSSPGFWGLTKNQLDRLNSNNIYWYAVLIARNSNSGYVFSCKEVNNRIADGTFELSNDGDHKINENSDCDRKHAFWELDELVTLVLGENVSS